MRTELLALVAASPYVGPCSGWRRTVEHANNDVSNQASLQRGARNFGNYCLGCHSAKYGATNGWPST